MARKMAGTWRRPLNSSVYELEAGVDNHAEVVLELSEQRAVGVLLAALPPEDAM